MLGFGGVSPAYASATVNAPRIRDADIYDRHAAGLYRQALLTLGDAGMAAQVVSDVIVAECTRIPEAAGDGDEASCRLPVSAYRRCQELASELGWLDRPPRRRVAEGVGGCIDRGWLLSRKERGALGLVLFGGLGYVQASHEAAISPLLMAALLHAVLHRLTTSSDGRGRGLWPPLIGA
jgi:hypothetical protein